MKETLHLLGSNKNRKRLKEAVAIGDADI